MPVHDWSKVEAGVFHDFHHELISTTKHVLNSGVLPAGYYAMADQVAGPGRPDVLALERTPRRPQRPDGGTTGAAVAVAPLTQFEEASDLTPRRRTRKRVVVRHVTGDDVVAVVEIVSPSNKETRRDLRDLADKVTGYLDTGIHALVVDLLRPSKRDPNGIHPRIWRPFKKRSSFQLPADKPLTLASYAAGNPVRSFVTPVAVGDALPAMPLFLAPGLHVAVPLEAAYAAAFALVPERWREVLAAAQPVAPPPAGAVE